jgi:hypothetical protein
MEKIGTLYKKDPNDLSRVINEVNPDSAWVFTDSGVTATRKYDGTACAIIGGELYKRYDVKKGKAVPFGAIPCQDPDPITGHWPHWVKCYPDNPADKFHIEGFNNLQNKEEGTYELVGPKVQGNPEKFDKHELVKHGSVLIEGVVIPSFEGFREYLEDVDIEGIVFHHPDGRMCKLRKSDYGIKRKPKIL